MRKIVNEVAFTGQRGVALFFIVSAFTLFLSYDNRKDELRPTLNFFIRRFFRLAPMFYVAVFLTLVLLRSYSGLPKHIAVSLVFLNGLHPLAINAGAIGGWSVADEALFYALLPLLFARIKSLRSALIWLVTSSIVCYILSKSLSVRYPSCKQYFQFLSFSVQFPVFMMGIAGYFFWKEYLTQMYLGAKKRLSLILLVAGAVLYSILLPFTDNGLYLSSFVCLILLIALSLHPWSIFVNRYTRFLGKISYSIYLLHFFIYINLQARLGRAGLPPTVQFILCFFGILLIVIPIAYLTWLSIEEPGIRLGRHVIAQCEGRKLRGKHADIFLSGLAVKGEGNSPDAQF